jgi:hypothetical protein
MEIVMDPFFLAFVVILLVACWEADRSLRLITREINEFVDEFTGKSKDE